MTSGAPPVGAVRHRMLLVLLVLTWAVSWPMVKIGVSVVPPLWYGVWRYLIACGCLFALLLRRRELAMPAPADWPLVAPVTAAWKLSLPCVCVEALLGFTATEIPRSPITVTVAVASFEGSATLAATTW